MGSTGLVILLLCLAFFVMVGLSATSNLIDTAQASNDTGITTAASGASHTLSPLFVVFGICILIVGMYAVIHAFDKM